MAKRNPTAIVAPSAVAFGTTPNEVLGNIRVVDAATGEAIARVIAADSDAGKVSRYAIDDGNLVREGNASKTIDENRKIRIEWIDPPVEPIADDGAPADPADGAQEG